MAGTVKTDNINDEAGTGAVTAQNGMFMDSLGPKTSGNPVAVTGLTDGTSAGTGEVGEELESYVTTPTFVTGSPTNVGSLSITAGEWDILVAFEISNGTASGNAAVRIYWSTTSGGTSTDNLKDEFYDLYDAGATSAIKSVMKWTTVNTSSTITRYLNIQWDGTAGGSGLSIDHVLLRAIRRR